MVSARSVYTTKFCPAERRTICSIVCRLFTRARLYSPLLTRFAMSDRPRSTRCHVPVFLISAIVTSCRYMGKLITHNSHSFYMSSLLLSVLFCKLRFHEEGAFFHCFLVIMMYKKSPGAFGSRALRFLIIRVPPGSSLRLRSGWIWPARSFSRTACGICHNRRRCVCQACCSRVFPLPLW